ncbi:Derepression protein [Salmonella enterica subsp. salamae]|nr:Derepression protein [Salmonella enterica subsp. salamae]
MIMSRKNTPHLSIESFHKLNRARNVSFQMHLQIRQCEVNALPLLWVPDIFSYISEDISAVLEEAKALGLCDNFTGNARIGQVSL